jgi:hypothetical protein
MKHKQTESSDFERFKKFVGGIMRVPGAEVKQVIEQEKRERKKKKRVKTSPASRASTDRA